MPCAPLFHFAVSDAALRDLSRGDDRARPLLSTIAWARQEDADAAVGIAESDRVTAVRSKYIEDDTKKLEPVATMPYRAGVDIALETQRLISSPSVQSLLNTTDRMLPSRPTIRCRVGIVLSR